MLQFESRSILNQNIPAVEYLFTTYSEREPRPCSHRTLDFLSWRHGDAQNSIANPKTLQVIQTPPNPLFKRDNAGGEWNSALDRLCR